jgi:hypothetical protein
MASAFLFLLAGGSFLLSVWGNADLLLQSVGVSEMAARWVTDLRVQVTAVFIAFVIFQTALLRQFSDVLEDALSRVPEPDRPKPTFTEGVDK